MISAIGYDEPMKYFFTVTNQGAGAAGPFTVNGPRHRRRSFLIPGSGAGRVGDAGRSGESCKVDHAARRPPTRSGQVAETDETNNATSFTETICLL